MSEKEEYVEVTLKVPKGIIDVLKLVQPHLGKSPEQYLEEEIIEFVKSDIESGEISDGLKKLALTKAEIT